MTKEEAIALYESEFWKSLTTEEIAKFGLFEDRLCMPFDVFHEAIEKVLGRPVWTHEFGMNRDGLKAEMMGDSPAPSMKDIINLIPEEKRLLILVDK